MLFPTMELLEGETLAERIGRRGALEAAEALLIARQLAAGIEAIQKDETRAGLAGLDLEARLARGEAETLAGRQLAARSRLAALAREAEAKGFGLLARRAAEASSAPRPQR
jgi:hypothetical protein